jgi:hypothetical protein
MAGSCARLLVPELSIAAIASWETIVARRSSAIEEDNFWVLPAVDEPRTEGALPFFWHGVRQESTDCDLDPEVVASVLATFGFTPTGFVSVCAMCRGHDSDLILGDLCQSFLTQCDGVLMFDGLLSPTLDLVEWRSWHEQSAGERAAGFPMAIGPHPGRIVAASAAGEPSYHVVDRQFLEFWMRHEAFHFVN